MPLESSMINLIGIKKFSLKFLIKRLGCYLLGVLEAVIGWIGQQKILSPVSQLYYFIDKKDYKFYRIIQQKQ